MYHDIPNYSSWSQNYTRRYKDSDVFDQIFETILNQAIKYNFIDMETVFGDGTHQKANANKNKHKDVEIKIAKKVYEDKLLEEINNDRIEHGKKPIETVIKKEIMFDENTGEVIENIDTKHIKESLTDPESGCYHKGEKEKCFAYTHQTFCDKNGFVIANVTTPGNTHDSVAFFSAYNILNEKYSDKIKNVCLDAGYVNPQICREIIINNQIPLMPYKRPMTGKGLFKKHEFVYDEHFDCYICPNNEILKYSTTDRKGYRQYKSDSEKCKNCQFKDNCTKSKNNQKVIIRHVWENYKEQMNENRYTKLWKEKYYRIFFIRQFFMVLYIFNNVFTIKVKLNVYGVHSNTEDDDLSEGPVPHGPSQDRGHRKYSTLFSWRSSTVYSDAREYSCFKYSSFKAFNYV